MSDVKEIKISNTVYDIVGKGVENQRDASKAKVWVGTNTQYNDLQSLDSNTIYYRTDNGGTVQTAVNAAAATSAGSATNDGNGNNIATTYATNTSLSDKANKGMDNLTDAGKVLISGLGMPSDTYEDLTLGTADTEYTAPANGYFAWQKTTNGTNQYFGMRNDTNKIQSIQWVPISNGGCQGFLPAKKGDICKVLSSAGGTTNYFRFIYAKGSESEAS